MWSEADDELVTGEFLDEQVNGFFPAAVVVEAVPNEAVLSSHVISTLARGRLGIYGCVILVFSLQGKSQNHLLVRPSAVEFWHGGTVEQQVQKGH